MENADKGGEVSVEQINEWVERAMAGEPAAFDRLVSTYQGRLYGLIYNMTSNREDTEDLLQDVFVKAYRYLPRFRKKSSFYTWIYRIAVNTTINFLRRKKKKYMMSLNDIDAGVERDPDYVELSARMTPSREAGLSEIQQKVNEAMLTLSEKHRTVVVMHDIQGKAHDEIAKILKCSSGTVRSRLFYARQQLQAALGDFIK